MGSRRRRWSMVAVAATAVFVVTVLAARGRDVASIEAELFRTANTAPVWLYRPVWPIMQFGNVLVACTAAVIVGALTRRWRVAVAGVVACVAAWYLAKVVKNAVERGRPEVYLPDVRLPGVPEDGFGFISGHSTVAFALATVLGAALPRRWRGVPFAIATVVAIARLYVGVHLPLDVVGGAAAGVAIGSVVNAVTALRDPVDQAVQSVATSPTGQATPVPPNPQ